MSLQSSSRVFRKNPISAALNKKLGWKRNCCTALRALPKRQVRVRFRLTPRGYSLDSNTGWIDRVVRGNDVSKNFDHKAWRRHEEFNRYIRHTRTLFKSRVLTQLTVPLLGIGLVSVAVSAFNSFCQGYLGRVVFQIPTEPFVLTSGIIGLLLVFRTNATFSRFWEARSLWALLTSRTRDLNRQAAAWFGSLPPEEREGLRGIVRRWTVALACSLKCHLRGCGSVEADLRGVLSHRELAALLAAKHRPLFAVQVLSEAVAACRAHPVVAGRMDRNLTALEDAVGACEKILRTPIPLPYTLHTSRFLVAWLAFLPLALWGLCGWATAPVAVAVAFCMMGLEEIGISLEEPFTLLPLDAMCKAVARDSQELLGMAPTRFWEGAGAEPAPQRLRALPVALPVPV